MFTKEVLDNGLRIVTEKLPNVRSLSIGIWVGTGSRNEVPQNNGVSHFIEHMMFKGTGKRTAKEIAETIDNIGGQINAFTGKEATCYYTKTLDSHYKIAIDLLSDIFFNSTFSESNIDLERGVISEEIGMYQDSLEELAHDILTEQVWHGNSLGYPILGTNKSLKSINRDAILKYIGERYTPQNTVISIAGSFEHDQIVEEIKKHFGNWKAKESMENAYNVTNSCQGVTLKTKKSEQTHICFGLPGVEYGSIELYSLLAVNSIFGGGMSSRLFQKIREEKGVAYSVYSFPSAYQKMGIFSIYAGLNPSYTEEVVKIIMQEINEIRTNKLTKSEIDKTKEQLKGNFILGLEGTGSRMTAIGKSETLQNKIYTPDEILQKIDSINEESICKVVDKVFDPSKICLAVVGNIKKDINFEQLIKAN